MKEIYTVELLFLLKKTDCEKYIYLNIVLSCKALYFTFD